MQHGGDLVDRLIDGGPAEHFPRHRAATDVAQKVQLGEPEQVGQSDGIGPRRRARPPWIRCQESVSAGSQDIRPGRRVPGPETRPVAGATLQKHRDRVSRRAAMEPITHHLKTFHRPDQRKHQAMKRWPLRLPRILPALGPTAHIPAEGLKRSPFADRQCHTTVELGGVDRRPGPPGSCGRFRDGRRRGCCHGLIAPDSCSPSWANVRTRQP
jgi:hypothetical protein